MTPPRANGYPHLTCRRASPHGIDKLALIHLGLGLGLPLQIFLAVSVSPARG